MESILVKLLSKYFNLFIKNFVKENFNLSLFKGEGKLSNLVLNEKVIQEILMLPTVMEVKSATCNELLVQVNWTKLKHEPIVFTLDKIEVLLSEPVDVVAMSDLMAQFKSNSKKKMSQFDTMLDVSLIINSVSIKVQNLPVPRNQPVSQESENPSTDSSITTPTSHWTPILEISIKGISVHTTNSNWMVVDLAKSKDSDYNDKEITNVYKELNAKTLSVILHTENNGKIILLEDSPIKIRLTSKWRMKDTQSVGATIELILNQLVLNTTANEWEYLIDYYKSMKACFARPVPEKVVNISVSTSGNVKTDTAEVVPKGYDVSYIVTINKWALEVLETNKLQPELTQVFDFEGSSGLRMVFTKSKKLIIEQNKITATSNETWATLTLPSFTLNRTLPSKNEVKTLLTNLSVENKKSGDVVAMKSYIKVLSTIVENSDIPDSKLVELQYNLKLDSAQVLLEKDLWIELYSLFKRNIKRQTVEEQLEKIEDENKVKLSDKLKTKFKKQMGMITDWNDISFTLEASNLKVLIPDISMNVYIDRILFMNHPTWESVPLLEKSPRFIRVIEEDPIKSSAQVKKALPPPPVPKKPPTLPPKTDAVSALTKTGSGSATGPPSGPPPLPPKDSAGPPPLPPKNDTATTTISSTVSNIVGKAKEVKEAVTKRIKSNTLYKFEADLSGVSIEVASSPLEKDVVFKTEKLRLYGCYSQNEPEDENDEVITEIETVLHAGAVDVKLTNEQFIKFFDFYKSYGSTIKQYIKNSSKFKNLKLKVKEKFKNKMEEAKEKGKEMFETNAISEMDIDPSTKVDDIKAKVKKELKKRKVAFFFKADKGNFDIPIRSLLKLQKLTSPVIKEKFGLGKKNQHIVPLKFEKIEMGFENTTESQNFMLKIKSMHMKELTIKKSPHIFTFEPLSSNVTAEIYKMFSLNTNDNYNFKLYYSRHSSNEDPLQNFSEIFLRLEDMHIELKKKTEEQLLEEKGTKVKEVTEESKEGAEKSNLVPNVQMMLQKIADMIDSKKDKIALNLETLKSKQGIIKDNLKKLKFDLRWQIEMGDCDVVYGGDDEKKPQQGAFRVSNGALLKQLVTRFLDLEHQLIQSKMDTAQLLGETQQDRDESTRKIKELEDKLAQTLKDRDVFEQKFVEAKMALSEVQMQNQDMQRTVFNLERSQKKI